ncbi:MAG: hypothetical protein R2834_10725 [Rhodothermales bacterium]
MIDTAYSLNSFPVASSALSPQIRFKTRKPAGRPAAAAPQHRAVASPSPAAAPHAAIGRKPHRGQATYFVFGLALLLVVVQASAWLPLEGAELLFVRLVLFAGAAICFLASSDKATPAVNV